MKKILLLLALSSLLLPLADSLQSEPASKTDVPRCWRSDMKVCDFSLCGDGKCDHLCGEVSMEEIEETSPEKRNSLLPCLCENDCPSKPPLCEPKFCGDRICDDGISDNPSARTDCKGELLCGEYNKCDCQSECGKSGLFCGLSHHCVSFAEEIAENFLSRTKAIEFVWQVKPPTGGALWCGEGYGLDNFDIYPSGFEEVLKGKKGNVRLICSISGDDKSIMINSKQVGRYDKIRSDILLPGKRNTVSFSFKCAFMYGDREISGVENFKEHFRYSPPTVFWAEYLDFLPVSPYHITVHCSSIINFGVSSGECKVSFIPELIDIFSVCGPISSRELVNTLMSKATLPMLDQGAGPLQKIESKKVSVYKYKRDYDDSYTGIQIGPLPVFEEGRDICFDKESREIFISIGDDEGGDWPDATRDTITLFDLKTVGKERYKDLPFVLDFNGRENDPKPELLFRGFATSKGDSCLWLKNPKEGSYKTLCVYKEKEDVVIELKDSEPCGIVSEDYTDDYIKEISKYVDYINYIRSSQFKRKISYNLDDNMMWYLSQGESLPMMAFSETIASQFLNDQG